MTIDREQAKDLAPKADLPRYTKPTVREATEDEVLAAFQMTAAEISAASCWWASCPTGCP